MNDFQKMNNAEKLLEANIANNLPEPVLSAVPSADFFAHLLPKDS